MRFTENVIPDLRHWIENGHRTALLTLVQVDGSSPRPIGSQIAVCDTGEYVGTLTGGCAEQALVTEAIECIHKTENHLCRYGAGSPYMDVVLPCGAGIDVHFEVQSVDKVSKEVFEAQEKRQTITLAVNFETCSAYIAPMKRQDDFTKTYHPPVKIFAYGSAINLTSFCDVAQAAGLNVIAHSPDQTALAYLTEQNIQTYHLTDIAAKTLDIFDQYSAVVTLFHEHDREINILHTALESEAFYIGALGSKRTHQARLDQLKMLAPTHQSLGILKGPIGLDIGASNPNEIAVSIVAEIITRKAQLYK